MARKSSGKAIKRVSRNKKGYWRKGVDVTDVEHHKDNVNLNDRLGLSNIAESDLFFIHKDPFDETGKTKIKQRVELRSLRSLNSDSAVPAFPEQKRALKSTQRRDRQLLAKNVKKFKLKSKSAKKITDEIRDLWTETNECDFGNVLEDLKANYLRFHNYVRPKMPNSMNRVVSILPSVELPHAGQSYNPTFEDHQELLKTAVETEMKKLRGERKLERKLAVFGDLATEASRFAEECQGLDILNKQSNEDTESEQEDEDIRPTVDDLFQSAVNNKLARKPDKVRRKEEDEKMKKKLRHETRKNKMMLNDVYRINSLNKQINKQEKLTNSKIARKKALQQARLVKAVKLGKTPYEAPDLEVQLSSDIKGNLRQLKPEGNLLEDRYKSFLRRNIIEGRKLQLSKKRKYRLKKYEKRDADVTADYVPR